MTTVGKVSEALMLVLGLSLVAGCGASPPTHQHAGAAAVVAHAHTPHAQA